MKQFNTWCNTCNCHHGKGFSNNCLLDWLSISVEYVQIAEKNVNAEFMINVQVHKRIKGK